jgi:hypothetical protein
MILCWGKNVFSFLFLWGSRATGAGGAEQLEPEEQSDWSRRSKGTRAGEAERLEQGERSDYSRGSGATGLEGAERLDEGE